MCTSLIDENKKVVMNLEAHNLQYISFYIPRDKGTYGHHILQEKVPKGLSIFRLNYI
jgi:hypothetical protein